MGDYSFEFKISKNTYFRGDFESAEGAESDLERISQTHCEQDNLAIGTLFVFKNRKLRKLKEYEIRLVGGEIIMKRFISK